MKLKARGCNVYILEDLGRKILIDAGTDGKLIASQIDELDAIILTHAHFDHLAGVKELERVFGCEVYAHPEEIPYVLGEKEFRYSGILGTFAKFLERLSAYIAPENVKSVFELKTSLKIVHLPGHTPGSVCVFKGFEAYCGDLLRGGGKLSLKSFCSDYERYRKSVEDFLKMEWQVAFPGHGKAIPRATLNP